MHKASEVVDIINQESLESYGVTKKKTQTPSTTIVSTSKSVAKSKEKTYVPRKVTQPNDYSRLYPPIKTPSSWGTPIVDKQLRKLATKPTLKQNYAEFEKKEYDQLINVVLRQTSDVLEGAGFVYKHGASDSAELRRLLGEFMQTKLAHIDESGRRRFVAVKEADNG